MQEDKVFYLFIISRLLFSSVGSLLNYLQSNEGESLPVSRLTSFAVSCTECVAYLHSRQIIHRDIAARNFLLTSMLTVKMSDFGMSKMSESYYGGNDSLFPIRWASPEVLERHKFSFESDRWALGVTLWEIFSLGSRPYLELQNKDVMDQVMNKQVKLRKRERIPDWGFEIIESCTFLVDK
jgi:serine/threonine protein kinase